MHTTSSRCASGSGCSGLTAAFFCAALLAISSFRFTVCVCVCVSVCVCVCECVCVCV